jgi:4-amino-4-deoxy-L-arabinose transferase-like glycosyltransferase
VGQHFGRVAGLLAALFMALTPVAVADNRNNTIDSILVYFLLLGAWAVSRAVDEPSLSASRRSGLRWLLLAAVFVGLGFNIKMLEAFLVVPAFGLVYLLGAHVSWRARLLHLLLATIVLLSVSLSWAVAVDLTPASQRPWVDSTTSNSEIDLAIGYNGLQRLLGRAGTPSTASSSSTTSGTNSRTLASGGSAKLATAGSALPAAATGATSGATGSLQADTAAIAAATGARLGGAPGGGQGNGGGGLFNNGAAGPLRLLDSQLGGQAGWLLPLAVIGLLAAAARRPRLPLDAPQRALLLWGGWLVTVAGFFSVASFFHSYYLVTIAPPIAALAAIGMVTLWQYYRESRSLATWRAWLLPVALVTTAAAQAAILRDYSAWSRWMTPMLLTGSIGASLVLLAGRLRRGTRLRLGLPVALAVGTAALLLAPTVWAANTASTVGSSIPSAGPSAQTGGFGGRGGFGNGGMPGGFGGEQGGLAAGVIPGGQPPTGNIAGQGQTSAPSGSLPSGTRQAPGNVGGLAGDSQLLAYLLKHQGSTKYLVVTSNSNSAASYIITTGKAVMSLGGFGGNDPILTTTQFQALVKNNTVRYVLGGGGGGGQGGDSAVMQWVQSSCKAVAASSYQTTSSSGTGTSGGFDGGTALYDCAGA